MAAQQEPDGDPDDGKDVPGRSESSPKIDRSVSIMSGMSGRNDRVDQRGVKIEKGAKLHRPSFRDQMQPEQPISDVQEVTAYKTPYLGGDIDDNGKTGCGCSIM